ncbi:sulfurtransferase TusA family protein [Paenibacillus lignilyticus]|uniref:Sulfurtransferase TusA family protein n=1 Tax=Paenibacillus lignilyticus TaxID=1172615 RepID=A0ABS5C9B6_9BACL|nr:sulfurtransferase TusA family protein [Paenibacillus lignilyticus]MBP3962596.1 sulfurtransferase TusA family protein [Paenibacillus lignilyticus]
MTNLQVNRTLECEGLACPLPVIRTKKTVEEMKTGEVLEVRATDKGSVADLQSWAKRTGHQYIGLKEDKGIFQHYIRKSDPTETKEESKFPHTISNEEIRNKLSAGEKLNILDVREPAEYAFGRIPGAQSIPLGELEKRLHELDPGQEYYLVCRSGNRSDLASQTLAEQGFKNVKNAVQGMTEWTGEVEKD